MGNLPYARFLISEFKAEKQAVDRNANLFLSAVCVANQPLNGSEHRSMRKNALVLGSNSVTHALLQFIERDAEASSDLGKCFEMLDAAPPTFCIVG